MKIFKSIFIILFISFLIIYFSEATGYYEYKNHLQKTFTSEQIKKFEEDVNSGNPIDVNQYILTDNFKYSNNLSIMFDKLSNIISNAVNSSVQNGFRLLSKLVDE